MAQALSASEATHDEGARSLLLPEGLPEQLVNRLGYSLLATSKPALASLSRRR